MFVYLCTNQIVANFFLLFSDCVRCSLVFITHASSIVVHKAKTSFITASLIRIKLTHKHTATFCCFHFCFLITSSLLQNEQQSLSESANFDSSRTQTVGRVRLRRVHQILSISRTVGRTDSCQNEFVFSTSERDWGRKDERRILGFGFSNYTRNQTSQFDQKLCFGFRIEREKAQIKIDKINLITCNQLWLIVTLFIVSFIFYSTFMDR